MAKQKELLTMKNFRECPTCGRDIKLDKFCKFCTTKKRKKQK